MPPCLKRGQFRESDVLLVELEKSEKLVVAFEGMNVHENRP